jgi:hypothetical protein
MLGHYSNFPRTLHRIESFSTSTSNKRLQQLLAETVFKLNNETFQLEEVSTPSIPNCSVIFEFGIAEDNDFSYLDTEEKNVLLKSINRRPLESIDFLCIIRYYKTEQSRRTRLKFDYYMLRFIFDKNLAEIRVFHEKGPMHVSPEDLISFVVKRINAASSKNVLKPVGSS